MITSYQRRKLRVKNSIIKNNKSKRPRIIVSRSNQNTYIQLVSMDGKTIATYSTLSFLEKQATTGIEKAKLVGKQFAKICLEKGINQVVFDKGGYSYSGRIKAIADSCRESGLKF
jgi:large subunit ribosomal protein L18